MLLAESLGYCNNDCWKLSHLLFHYVKVFSKLSDVVFCDNSEAHPFVEGINVEYGVNRHVNK